MAKIVAICTSSKKGLQKKEVPFANVIEDFGIEGDAHAGKWHRQISFLDKEEIDEFNKRGAQVVNGAFGENFIVSGLDAKHLPVGSWLRCGEVIFEVTQKVNPATIIVKFITALASALCQNVALLPKLLKVEE